MFFIKQSQKWTSGSAGRQVDVVVVRDVGDREVWKGGKVGREDMGVKRYEETFKRIIFRGKKM